MTPDEAISAAFRAASTELARTSVRPDAYEGFLAATKEHLDLASQFFSKIAVHRDKAGYNAITTLEHQGLREILQATVSTLLALGHYPYLDRIHMDGEPLQ
ncbi:MAG: hypothetical protein V3T08_10045 [Gemmatimonadota bacterium]